MSLVNHGIVKADKYTISGGSDSARCFVNPDSSTASMGCYSLLSQDFSVSSPALTMQLLVLLKIFSTRSRVDEGTAAKEGNG